MSSSPRSYGSSFEPGPKPAFRIFRPEFDGSGQEGGEAARDVLPEISLLVSSYNKPRHLRLCLASIGLQQHLNTTPEVVVTDDGSNRETLDVVAEFASETNLPVVLTTHRHAGFQLARCRNDGVRASSAPYLLFLDGDCVLPPDHVAIHLELRKTGCVMAGDYSRLDEEISRRVTLDVVARGDYLAWESPEERKRLRRRHRSVLWHRWIHHPRKPTLIGNNVGIWRSDYERVNGYDEEFIGWGCEDDDLARRLRRVGLSIRSVLHRTRTFHIWHPVDVTAPARWKDGANVKKLFEDRPTVCRLGLKSLEVNDDSPREVLPMYREPTVVTRFPRRDSTNSKTKRHVA
jgi:glycosyltransferase involved in cell wall biosynthesis